MNWISNRAAASSFADLKSPLFVIAAVRALDFVRRIFLLARADLQEQLELSVLSTLDELSVLFVVTRSDLLEYICVAQVSSPPVQINSDIKQQQMTKVQKQSQARKYLSNSLSVFFRSWQEGKQRWQLRIS